VAAAQKYFGSRDTKNTIQIVNKVGSNAVYVVVAVALILVGSAQASPVQSASNLLACTAVQLSLSFSGEGGAFKGTSQPRSLLILRNISVEVHSAPPRPSIISEHASQEESRISLERSPGIHLAPVIQQVALTADVEAIGDMHRVSKEAFGSRQSLSRASVDMPFRTYVVSSPSVVHLGLGAGQDAKYRFAYLKRDLVYVRSKS